MEPIDFSFIDETNALVGAAVVIASYIFGEHWVLFVAFIALNILDFFTGIAKSKLHKTENSAAGLKGIVKKLSYWCMLLVAFIMAPIFNELGEVIGADVSMFTPAIGYMVLAMLIMNEFRSILENLYACGVNVPSVLMKGLSIFEKVTTDIEDSMFDGNLEIHSNSEEKYQVKIDTPDEELEQRASVTLKIQTISDEDE